MQILFFSLFVFGSGSGTCTTMAEVITISTRDKWPLIIEVMPKSSEGYCSRGSPIKGKKAVIKVEKEICDKNSQLNLSAGEFLSTDCKGYQETIAHLKAGDAIIINQDCSDSMGPKGMVGGCLGTIKLKMIKTK